MAQIQPLVQSEKMKNHLDEVRSSIKTEIVDEEFMGENPATAAGEPPPQPPVDVNLEVVRPRGK
jgi:hypothetical protein